MLVRSRGVSTPHVQTDVERSRSVPDDVYLACTNGLVEALGDADVAWIFASSSEPHDTSDRLVRTAREAGARDDIPAVVVSISSPRLALDVNRRDLARETSGCANAPATA